MLLVMFYAPLCYFVLQYFDCTSQPDDTYTLDAEPSTYCYSGVHMDNMKYAIAGVVIYMIGIPAFVFVSLKLKFKLLYEQTISDRYGFLYMRFKEQYYYWYVFIIIIIMHREGIILLRLCVLTVALVLMASWVPIQTMLGLIILFFSALYHQNCKVFDVIDTRWL